MQYVTCLLHALQAEVNLLSKLLKAHGGSDRPALEHLQAQAAGGHFAQVDTLSSCASHSA